MRALASNVLFSTYGLLAHIYPVVFLHMILLPINLLKLWREQGWLKLDPKPALYVATQTYKTPGGKTNTFSGVYAELKLEDYKTGIVRKHEKEESSGLGFKRDDEDQDGSGEGTGSEDSQKKQDRSDVECKTTVEKSNEEIMAIYILYKN